MIRRLEIQNLENRLNRSRIIMNHTKTCCRCGVVLQESKILYRSIHDGVTPICAICHFDERAEAASCVLPKNDYWNTKVFIVSENAENKE